MQLQKDEEIKLGIHNNNRRAIRTVAKIDVRTGITFFIFMSRTEEY